VLYSLIKTLHILAITVWILGLLLLSSSTGFAGAAPATLRRLARWNRGLILPAMALTWLFGLMMGGMVGWIGQMWLDMKMGLVALLTLLHLWQTHVLSRRIADADYRAPGWLGLSGAAVFLITAMAVTLAVAKPFF
ncbi:putative membrane protein, partial [Bordetella avium 197N]